MLGPALRHSARMQAVQSPIIPIVAEWIRDHPGTISLGQGVVSYGPPPEAFEQVTRFAADPENHKYKAVQGLPELITALSAKLRTANGIRITAANPIVVTAGGNMAFLNAILAIADPGDEIILQTPYYFNHEMAVCIANCRPVLAATDANYQLQPEAIRAAITPRTRAVVTVSPNNPTGAVYEEGALCEVNRLCAEQGIYHIHDEAYENFTYGEARHFSPASIAGSAGHTISLFSFSKGHGMASWRVGYMVLPEPLLAAVKKVQDTNLICAPVVSQFAALGALQAGAAYCKARLAELEEVRAMVWKALGLLEGLCDIPRADGAFYYLLRLHTGRDPLEMARWLIREHRVAVIPGNAFGATGCYLRISYGPLSKNTAAEGIGRLVTGLKKLLGK